MWGGARNRPQLRNTVLLKHLFMFRLLWRLFVAFWGRIIVILCGCWSRCSTLLHSRSGTQFQHTFVATYFRASGDWSKSFDQYLSEDLEANVDYKAIETGIILVIDQWAAVLFVNLTKVYEFVKSEGFLSIHF